MNEASPIMYHGNGYGGGVYMVPGQMDRSRQYPLEMLQVLSSAGRGNGEHGQVAPRRWQARRERQPSKDNTAFSYDSDDSSLSSNASGSNKSSEKGEGSSRAGALCAGGAAGAAGAQQREWRARPKRDFRPRRIPLERFATVTYPSQIKFTPDDLLNGSKWDSLSQEIWDKFMKSQQTDETFRKKMNLWRYLSMAIRSMFPRYSLYVVGSTMSGFGLDNSDMDLCLHVRAHQHVEARAQALLHLSYLLDYIRTFDSGAELIHAKVPILKFRDVRNGLQVDLNCNNVVGIRNTDMLIYFSRLDWRVRPLVAVTKLWARAHRINDARRRTLSSYALTLMVIHYLQCGTSPPLLVRPEAAHERRAHHNRATLAELFLHMLKYYADFPYEQMAISVRVKRLPLAECRVHDPHQWKWLCVEEPFDLSNTARSVYDPEMFEKIVSTFRESYKRLSVGLRLADAWPAAPPAHVAPPAPPADR